MKNGSIIFLGLWLSTLSLSAQLPERIRKNWHRGKEFYELELYANAQDRLEVEASPMQGLQKEWSEYRVCLSALELVNSDAEYLVLTYSEKYPESPYTSPLFLQTGDHFFRFRNYKKSVDWFSKVPSRGMDATQQQEVRFKSSYSHFMLNNDSAALTGFERVAVSESEYRSAAIYYSSYIKYTDSLYESSLQGFESLKEDAQFGTVAPYYLAQIYYKTGRYDQLITLSEELLQQKEVVRRDEIERLLADSYYRKDDFGKAAIHFERYKELGGRFRSQDRFQMGYSYYRINRYPEAIEAFNKITDAKGPLSQDAWYYLGDCYLKTGDKSKALTAFDAASKLNTSPELRKQSNYLFVKLNYELDGPYQDVGKAIDLFLKNQNPSAEQVRELNALLANYYIHQRNYPKALEALRTAGSQNAELRAAHQKVAYYQGIQLLNAGKFKASRELFAESRQYVVNDLLYALSFYWTGEALYREGSYQEAAEKLSAFRESPGASNTSEFVIAEYDIAYCHYRLKEWEQAASMFRAFSDHYDEEDATISDARVRAADCYFMQGRYKVAEEYYRLAAKYNEREADYALLQQGNCLGLLGNDTKKISVLLNLASKYPQSSYRAEASYEVANTYLKLDKNVEALSAFATFRREHPNHPLVRTALLNEGLAFRNSNELDSSVTRLKQVVERYPATEEANEAISFARLVYSDLGKIDEYIDWVQRIDFADVQTAKLDSTLYNSAFEAYALNNCQDANLRFGQYLERFPKGLFIRKVHYYHAICLEKEDNKTEANKQWEALFQLGQGNYRDIAAFQLGVAAFEDSAYGKARDYFLQLHDGDDPQKIRESKFYLLKIAVFDGNQDATIELANTVLEDVKTSPERITYSLLMRARARFELKRYDVARSDYLQLYENPKGVSAAEAGYHLARILNLNGEYQKSVDKVYESMERTPGFARWREESLFLLVENFIELGDHFQAEYILEALEKGSLTWNDMSRIEELKKKLEEQPEQVEAREIETEQFKSLQLDDLPTVELPEEEGEELIIKAPEDPELPDPDDEDLLNIEEEEEGIEENFEPKSEDDEDGE